MPQPNLRMIIFLFKVFCCSRFDLAVGFRLYDVCVEHSSSFYTIRYSSVKAMQHSLCH